MTSLPLLLVLALAWLGYLVRERVLLDRHRRAVPLRIAVTGTRGKTGVTRLLAAVLRAGGRTVLAKTTGSEAAYVLPDGSDEAIKRRGRPSIIEQKALLRRAARLRADVVVAEIMSIHPEIHRVEARELLRPHLVLVTNFRPDHVEAQGATPAEVASVLALDVPPGASAYVPEEEWQPDFAGPVERSGGVVRKVPAGTSVADGAISVESPGGRAPVAGAGTFASNLDLVFAVARSLGIGDDVIRAGIANARGDIGAFGVWRYPLPAGRGPWFVVNAFAANDPESTLRIHDRVIREHGLDSAACVGLLSLRADRGERTLQWAESLGSGSLLRFRRLWLTGGHAHALRHRLRHAPGADRLSILPDPYPDRAMKQVLDGESASGWLFGFGNIGGPGADLVRHWRAVGVPLAEGG